MKNEFATLQLLAEHPNQHDGQDGSQNSLKWVNGPPHSMTAIRLPLRSSPLEWEFGWYWGAKEELRELVTQVKRSGYEFSVWDTPQFEAVEWLVGAKISLPAHYDEGLFGFFYRVLMMHWLLKGQVPEADLVSAEKFLSEASALSARLADKLLEVHSGVFDWLDTMPTSFGCHTDALAKAQLDFAVRLGSMKGIVATERIRRAQIHEGLIKGKDSGTTGRPANWVAEQLAMYAADIYVTAGFVWQKRFYPNRSFRSFLERFSIGFPEAERADKKEITSRLFNGGYEPVQFAPVSLLRPKGVKV